MRLFRTIAEIEGAGQLPREQGLRFGFARRLSVLAAIALAIVAGIGLWRLSEPGQSEDPRQIGPAGWTVSFSLVDETGRAVTDESYRGQWLLVLFGYTNCADACAPTLGNIAEALRQLGDATQDLQPIFITLDPARDTPEAVSRFLSKFEPRIAGLTGTQEQVSEAARSFRLSYDAAERRGPNGGNQVDHAAFVYLIDPSGALERAFPYEEPAAELARALRKYVD